MMEEEIEVDDIDRLVTVFNIVFADSEENLALLAKHCPLDTLRSIRLVSRHFRNASRDSWRKKTVLRIDASPQNRLDRSRRRIKPSRNYLDICEFFGMLDNPEKDCYSFIKYPVQSFILKLYEDHRTPGVLNQFVRRFGHQIVGIYLNGLRPFHGDAYTARFHEDFKNVSQFTFENCQLELGTVLETVVFQKATFVKVVYHYDISTHSMGYEISNFLRVFPNMKVLCVNLNVHERDEFPKLQLMEMEAEKSRSPTESIPVYVGVGNGCEIYFEEFLRVNASSFRKMILYRPLGWCASNAFPFKIRLPSLEELHLWSRAFDNLYFLKWTPILRKLVILEQPSCLEHRFGVPMSETCMSKVTEWPSSHDFDFAENIIDLMSIPTMEHLVHLELDTELSDKKWGRLVEIIPNLKVLKTVLNNKSLGVICRLWRQLKVLSLMFGSQVDDQAITGVEKWKVPIEVASIPNLTDLEGLTDFELMTYSRQSNISNFSVYHGFLKMPNLKYLSLCVSPKVTREAIELLKCKISCVKIRVHW